MRQERIKLSLSWCAGEYVFLKKVIKYIFLLPPSAPKPALSAIASRIVDLPLPFSPTKKVTALGNSISSSCFIIGKEKGYLVKSTVGAKFTLTLSNRGPSARKFFVFIV